MHLVLLAGLLAGTIGVVADRPAPTDSPLVAALKTYEAAANRHDWKAVSPLLAERTVIELGGDLALVGRDEARGLHDWERAMGTKTHYSECTAAGTTVTCRATEENDFLRLMDLGVITYTTSAITFEDRRVVRMTATLSEESARQVSECMQGFLTWAGRAAPRATATFLKPDGSFAFGYEQGMTFKRLLRLYLQAKAGGSRTI